MDPSDSDSDKSESWKSSSAEIQRLNDKVADLQGRLLSEQKEARKLQTEFTSIQIKMSRASGLFKNYQAAMCNLLDEDEGKMS